jgi:hypothetical protein
MLGLSQNKVIVLNCQRPILTSLSMSFDIEIHHGWFTLVASSRIAPLFVSNDLASHNCPMAAVFKALERPQLPSGTHEVGLSHCNRENENNR